MQSPVDAVNKKSASNGKILKFISEMGDDDTKFRVFKDKLFETFEAPYPKSTFKLPQSLSRPIEPLKIDGFTKVSNKFDNARTSLDQLPMGMRRNMRYSETQAHSPTGGGA